MPDFPIIDTHLHLWNPSHLSYPWLHTAPVLDKPYLLADFEKARRPVDVAKMVFLQCDCVPEQSVAELEWVTSLAATDPRIAGIVARVPLERGAAVAEDLDRLVKADSRKLLRGIRRIIQGEPDVAFCKNAEFIRGVQTLAKYQLSFDICAGGDYLEHAPFLAEHCPEVKFILDHIGGPDIKSRKLDPWRKRIKALAALPNVSCKISGVATEADFKTWTKEDVKPYILHVLDCFGWDRVLFGGDWPVSTQATTYPRWVETLDWMTADATEQQRRALFHDNAARFYRL